MQRKKRISLLFFILYTLPLIVLAQAKAPPQSMKVGYSISIKNITLETMQYAKSVGISCINVSLNPLVDHEGNINMSDTAIQRLVLEVGEETKNAGIIISAFHMPYGEHVDLSLINEIERRRIVALHEKLLQLCAPLKPAIVLFHPSWYLSLNERDVHIKQLVKSINELSNPVKRMGAIMVIENMTGPQLYVERKGVKYERPLFRTVDETMKIMNMLPADIYAAVDMNHILHPEKLILALGKRLKFIHVSDGDGEHEYHYFPCSGKGMNDWDAILSALQTVGYKGPFMFECHYKDVRDLKECYDTLFAGFIRHNDDESSK